MRSVLASHGMHATFFPVGNNPAGMSLQQLRDLASDGNEIGGHTLDHPDLTKISVAEATHQICDDRKALIANGFSPVSFAYPYGAVNSTVKQIVQGCGYSSARGVWGTWTPSCDYCDFAETIPPQDPFLTRIAFCVEQSTPLSVMQSYVTMAEQHGGGWVQICFHHVCDGCNLYSTPLATLTAFLDWLQPRRSSGTVVKTIQEALASNSPAPVNRAPLLTAPAAQSGVVGQQVSLQLVGSDPDAGQTLSWSASGLPAGLSINASSGLISGTIGSGATAGSPFTVTVTLTDNGSPLLATSKSFTWTIGPASGGGGGANRAPLLTAPAAQSGVVGQQVSLQLVGSDPDAGQTLSWSASGLPAGLSINASSGLISGTIGSGATAGSPFTVTVTLTDNGSPLLATSKSFTWTIGPASGGGGGANRAPLLTAPAAQSGVVGQQVSLQLVGSDPDAGQTLSWSASGLPAGLSINASSGLISGTIGSGATAGSPFTVTVTLTDNGSPLLATSKSFTWTIGPASGGGGGATQPLPRRRLRSRVWWGSRSRCSRAGATRI